MPMKCPTHQPTDPDSHSSHTGPYCPSASEPPHSASLTEWVGICHIDYQPRPGVRLERRTVANIS